jgi:V/A-type H+-transporting ATPase subunit F
MQNENRAAVIGDGDSVSLFKATGLDVFPIVNPFEAKDKIKELARLGYVVVFITEALAAELKQTLDKYKETPYPAIIPLPGAGGGTGFGMQGVREDLERAVGTNLLFK